MTVIVIVALVLAVIAVLVSRRINKSRKGSSKNHRRK